MKKIIVILLVALFCSSINYQNVSATNLNYFEYNDFNKHDYLNSTMLANSNSGSSNNLEITPITFCEDNNVLLTFQIVGYIIFIIKIVVPLILIIMGVMDFAKAAISSSDKANSEALSSLIRRIIAGVIIFFIPTVISFGISLIDGFSKFQSEDSTFGEKDRNNSWTKCTVCLLHPFDDDCEAKPLFKD